jgi:hypothetical protein
MASLVEHQKMEYKKEQFSTQKLKDDGSSHPQIFSYLTGFSYGSQGRKTQE